MVDIAVMSAVKSSVNPKKGIISGIMSMGKIKYPKAPNIMDLSFIDVDELMVV